MVPEVVGSFFIGFGWLMVRNFKLAKGQDKWMVFIGPLLVSIIYEASLGIGASIGNGPMHSFLALEQLFWSASTYNQIDDPIVHPNATHFSYMNFGRYAWVYIISPLIPAFLAGFLARKHFTYIDTQMDHIGSFAEF